MFEDLETTLKSLSEVKSPGDFKKLIGEMANKIHPDSTKLVSLVSALKSIKDVNKVIELSEDLSDKLCNMEIDLYALIKDIHEEKEVPKAMLEAMEAVLERPNEFI